MRTFVQGLAIAGPVSFNTRASSVSGLAISNFDFPPEVGSCVDSRTEDDSATWAGHRQKTCMGSLKHFLKCAVTGVLTEEKFTVYTGSIGELSRFDGRFISWEVLSITPDPLPGVYRMSFGGWIRIDYSGYNPGTRNLLTLHAPCVRVDRDGNLLARFGMERGRSWSKCGVADLLPMH